MYLKDGEDEGRLKSLVESEIKAAIIRTDSNGIVLRCDTIGSLEAYGGPTEKGQNSHPIC